MLYKTLQLLIPILLKLFFNCRVEGLENIPRTGGVIIAANHVSNWDPPVAAAFVPRVVNFMAKEELFKVPLFGAVIRWLNAFPVRRGAADRAAIKKAIELLKDGQCLGLFPEGTRSRTGTPQKPEPGLALIAVKSGAVIVPAAVDGTRRIFSGGNWFPQITIKYGRPITVERGKADKDSLQALAERVMADIGSLLDGIKR